MGRSPALAIAASVTASGITTAVVKSVRGPLFQRGFAKRSSEVFTRELTEGVIGWVGLNRAYRRGENRLEVNPVIGVRHQAVERLVAELRGDKFHTYLPPTVSTPLGYLSPAAKYEPWFFDRQSPIDEVAADMVAAIARYGLPFMKTVSGLEELRRQAEQGLGFPHQLAYRLPVVCLLAGDPTAASDWLRREVTALKGRTDRAASDFRSFAERLQRRVDQVATESS